MKKTLGLLTALLIAVLAVTPVLATPGDQLIVQSSNSDAYLYSWDMDDNYTDVHDRLVLDGDNGDVYNDLNLYVGQDWYIGMGYNVYRAVLYFDTTLPNNAIIDSVTFEFCRAGIWDSDNFTLCVVEGTGLNDPLTGADYGTLLNRTTIGGSIASANMSEPYPVRNEISLNTDGVSWINKDGWTILGLRTDGDINASTPTTDEYVCVEPSEWGDIYPGYGPELIIDYHIPTAPTNFLVTDLGGNTVNITWTKDASANNTEIRMLRSSYADNVTEGELVYFGTGSSTTEEGLSLETTTFYFSAWSEESGTYSEDYATDSIGGEGMLTVGLIFMMVALAGAAFWRKEPVLYILGVIGWLFLTFYMVNQSYPPENEYLPWAIAVFCLSVVLIMAVQVVRVYFSDKVQPPTSWDVQAEHRRKVLALTKPRRKKEPWEV